MWMSQSVITDCKLYYDIKNHILLYPLFSFLCGCHNLLTQRVSYTMISKTILIVSSFLFPIWISQSVNTGSKLYYDIKFPIIVYPLFSFLCKCHNLFTQDVSYTMISKLYLIVSSFLFPMWMSQYVHTACKLYYNIKNHILLYPLFSFLCVLYFSTYNMFYFLFITS